MLATWWRMMTRGGLLPGCWHRQHSGNARVGQAATGRSVLWEALIAVDWRLLRLIGRKCLPQSRKAAPFYFID